jgi:hypothetical protein
MDRTISSISPPSADVIETEAGIRTERIRTLLLALCIRADGSEPRVRVCNLSAKGICGARGTAIDFAVGEPVHIAFGNVAPIAASVTWIDGGQLGFAFRNPISLADLVTALASGTV